MVSADFVLDDGFCDCDNSGIGGVGVEKMLQYGALSRQGISDENKTLEARLGFFRRERLQCKVKFSVSIVGEQG